MPDVHDYYDSLFEMGESARMAARRALPYEAWEVNSDLLDLGFALYEEMNRVYDAMYEQVPTINHAGCDSSHPMTEDARRECALCPETLEEEMKAWVAVSVKDGKSFEEYEAEVRSIYHSGLGLTHHEGLNGLY